MTATINPAQAHSQSALPPLEHRYTLLWAPRRTLVSIGVDMPSFIHLFIYSSRQQMTAEPLLSARHHDWHSELMVTQAMVPAIVNKTS